MRSNPQCTADLATFTEEILNGKIHFFLFSVVKVSILGLKELRNFILCIIPVS